MIVKFDKDYLRQLYSDGTCKDKKHRYQPGIVKNYRKCVDLLIAAPCIEKLYTFPALNYEVLTGDKKGISSVRINLQYRMEFAVELIADEPVVTVCTILDISNHYK